MSSLRSCSVSENVSFPLRNSITDVNSYYTKINQPEPNMTSSFEVRTTNPVFVDETRISGIINEKKGAITITFNDVIYNLLSVQLCLATHTAWIPLVKNKPVNNKIDIIITLENEVGADPRYNIIVVPLIIDDNVTNDNNYLRGLAFLDEYSTYSLNTLFIGLNKYFFYTTCLEPHADKAFVYVNTDGLKISQNLYNSLLALWTNQNISKVQQQTMDNASALKRVAQNYCQNINNTTDVTQIQHQLNNMQAETQLPVVDNLVDTWPRYVPPYDVVLNVPGKIITSTTMESFQNKEGFSDTLGATSSGSFLSLETTANKDASGNVTTGTHLVDVSYNGVDYYLAKKTTSIPLGNMQCVPLDLDSSVNTDGSINFDIDGHMLLSDVQMARNARRLEAGVRGTLDLTTIAENGAIAIGVIIGIFVVVLLLRGAVSVFYMKNQAAMPTWIKDVPIHVIILIIVGFAGFLIGAAVMR